MPWVALTLELDEPHTEAFSDALLEAGAQSVCIEDADAGSGAETPRYAEPPSAPAVAQGGGPAPAPRAPEAWRHNRVHALLSVHSDPAGLVGAAARAAGLARAPRFAIEHVADQDWVRRTQSQHAPLRITEQLWIVPTWHEPPDARACNVRIDPGLAFGTGTHPSTRLALRWLTRIVPALAQGGSDVRPATAQPGDAQRSADRAPAPSVLDYGCGSGILAIAAARLGASQVHAVDSDPLALEATASNARLNSVAIRAAAPPDLPPGDYAVVVANILADPLIVLAPLLISRTRPRGHLALSGILATQAQEVIAAYAPFAGLAVSDEEEGWVLLAGTRAAPQDAPGRR